MHNLKFNIHINLQCLFDSNILMFQAMNNDLDEIVKQCLAAKRHLQAVEDSNRSLKQEERSLRSKYEALLEKNRKDTGIIMRLKVSVWPSVLPWALSKRSSGEIFPSFLVF